MLSLEQARDTILSRVIPVGMDIVPGIQALGRFTGEDVPSTVDLPLFDNSAMDGYAVRHTDLKAASSRNPVRLVSVARIGAGEPASITLKSGECARIFTGSPLPAGADAVVMQEDAKVDETRAEVLFPEPVRPIENVRLRGEDVRAGSVLARQGQRVTAALTGLLAACGVAEMKVGKRVRVGLVSTGSELMEPGAPLQPGAIYESNRTMLAGLLHEIGAVPLRFPLVADSLEETRQAIQNALAASDVVITTGGVSVGEFDFVKEALENLGGKVEFWKVAIKPGKPFVFSECGGKLIFGLPGNPVSALVTFLLLVRPALLKMQGARDLLLPRVKARIAGQFHNRGGRRHFVRVQLNSAGEAHLSGPQASHRLGALGMANGLLDLGPESAVETGEEREVMLWGWPAG